MFRLDGKIALVSGASRGLGWGMAKALASQGAHVFLNGRDPVSLGKRVLELTENRLLATAMAFDVTQSAKIKRAVAQIVSEQGRIDILVANAGIQHRAPISEFDEDDFRRVMDTNLIGVWALAKEVSKSMVQARSGRIIFTGSITAQLGRPTISAYIASKGGVHSLARQLAVELGDKGITANVIAPGYFATEMNEALIEDKDFNHWVCSRVPVRRWGEVDEIGSAAVFLASDESAYVNGHVLTVDGGFSISM
ncbi:MAG: SDR family oxidoreductase [Proteobacteria bacterium]|nr:SDR family oxidoreductase [Pseudomonadota bacterium]MDA1331642.1 SDR family oxidoreductase [Pseudomonadota bacterium]